MRVIYVVRGTGAAEPVLLASLRAYGYQIEVVGHGRKIEDAITRRMDLLVLCA